MSKSTFDTNGLTGSFSKDNMNNQFGALFQGDSSPLRPRAQSTPNMTVAVNGTPAESYYSPFWLATSVPANYTAGSSPSISAPSVNPRIDILYLNSSNVLAWVTGTEAAAPEAPAFGLNGIPICYVYARTTMTTIVNYEDKDANPTQGYIYQDIRPNYSFVSAGARHLITRGFELTYKSTADVYIEPGTLYHNTTEINATARTTLTLAAGASWWDGAVDSYSSAAGWCYIAVNPSGDKKFIGANAPDKADVDGNTVGTLLYWYDGSIYWRVIGAIRVTTSDLVADKFYQVGDWINWDDPGTNHKVLDWGTATSFTDIDCSAHIPAFSKLVYVSAEGSKNGEGLRMRANGSSAADGIRVSDNNSSGYLTIFVMVPTDSSQVIEYKGINLGQTPQWTVNVNGFYIGNIR